MDTRRFLAVAALSALIAGPGVYAADDDPSAEARTSVKPAESAGVVRTVEGRLVSLHRFMTVGGSAESPAAEDGPWVLVNGPEAILLSDLPSAPVVAAARRPELSPTGEPEDRPARIGTRPDPQASSNRDVLDRDEDVAGIDRPIPEPGLSDRDPENAPRAKSPDRPASDRVLGIPRRDLDRVAQRVRATGTLYNRNNMKYMLVSSVTPIATPRPSTLERAPIPTERPQRPLREAPAEVETETEVESESSEVEIKRETEREVEREVEQEVEQESPE